MKSSQRNVNHPLRHSVLQCSAGSRTGSLIMKTVSSVIALCALVLLSIPSSASAGGHRQVVTGSGFAFQSRPVFVQRSFVAQRSFLADEELVEFHSRALLRHVERPPEWRLRPIFVRCGTDCRIQGASAITSSASRHAAPTRETGFTPSPKRWTIDELRALRADPQSCYGYGHPGAQRFASQARNGSAL